MLINFIVLPWLVQRQIIPTDYGSFLEMVDNKQVGEVQIQTNQILLQTKKQVLYIKLVLWITRI